MKFAVDNLRRQISDLYDEIESIQNSCPHNNFPLSYRHSYPPYVNVKYGSNTGGYDLGYDSYWINCHCEKCDAKWTIDSEN